MSRNEKPSSDSASFRILAYEFPGDDHADAERKIKGKLRRDRLGAYDERRVNRLRELRDYLQREIYKPKTSKYYKGPTGQYAAIEDFDAESLAKELSKRFPEFDPAELFGMVGFAIYVYYLR